uniref:Uncharacterized protein n=1 Tax=Nothoprocta perdicaria TaxID=30464 RepID=A0A8C6ZD91_NOTPE
LLASKLPSSRLQLYKAALCTAGRKSDPQAGRQDKPASSGGPRGAEVISGHFPSWYILSHSLPNTSTKYSCLTGETQI